MFEVVLQMCVVDKGPRYSKGFCRLMFPAQVFLGLSDAVKKIKERKEKSSICRQREEVPIRGCTQTPPCPEIGP